MSNCEEADPRQGMRKRHCRIVQEAMEGKPGRGEVPTSLFGRFRDRVLQGSQEKQGQGVGSHHQQHHERERRHQVVTPAAIPMRGRPYPQQMNDVAGVAKHEEGHREEDDDRNQRGDE